MRLRISTVMPCVSLLSHINLFLYKFQFLRTQPDFTGCAWHFVGVLYSFVLIYGEFHAFRLGNIAIQCSKTAHTFGYEANDFDKTDSCRDAVEHSVELRVGCVRITTASGEFKENTSAYFAPPFASDGIFNLNKNVRNDFIRI
jgi:hypothetical protein